MNSESVGDRLREDNQDGEGSGGTEQGREEDNKVGGLTEGGQERRSGEN